MAKRQNFREDNLDYKELLKRRADERQKLATKKNPFILSVSETDHETYSKLYKFNPDEILNEFNKGGSNGGIIKTTQSDKKASLSMSKSRQTEAKSPNKSKISEKVYREQEEFEMEDQQFLEEDEYENGHFAEEGDENQQVYTEIILNLFNESMKKPVNKIQNALFVDQYVAAEQAQIVTGEQAISFFAKYGNTTPIKFINCVKDDQHPPEIFRPYDLKVNNVSENQKELTLDEYYTISAHGIVHVFTAKGKKALGNSDTSTEVISLSDWMHESTMFNIITNIQFFKNYAITKIFNIWKANVHYRIFCKTRKKLIHDTFIAKPAFANHLMSINQHMYEIQNTKTVSNSIVQSKIWDQEEFKQDQKKARQEAQRNYESIVEKVITLVEVVCKEVDQRTKIKEQSEIEEARFGQQVKSKPRYEIALEAKERAYLLERAIKDREKLRNFIRLVDYLCVETLVQTNHISQHTLLEEMKKERKQGLFGSTVIFDVQKMSFSPDEKDVTDTIVKLLEDMVTTMQSSSLRVVHHFESYIKNLSTENICDVSKIIFDSVEFDTTKREVLNKINTDFKMAQNHVDTKYENCRVVHDFKTTWNFEAFKAEEQKIETIKYQITNLNKWLLDIQQHIKDVVQGVVQIQGSKIKSNLDDFVKKQLELIRVYLYEQMKRKAEQLHKQLQQYNSNLSKPPSNALKDYATYINFYNEVQDAAKDSKLEKKKQEIEEMHYELKIKFTSVASGSSTSGTDELLLENIQNEYMKIGRSIKEAETNIKDNQPSMIKKMEADYQKLQQDIKQTALSVNQPILCSEETSSTQALSLLQTIKTQIEGNQNKVGGEFGGLQGKYRNLHYYASLMQFTLQETRDLKDLESKYNDRNMLWSHYDEFQTKEDDWKKNPFNQLNSEDVEKDMRKYKQGIAKLKMNIHNLTTEDKDRVLETYEKKFKNFETNMPIIIALGNKDLQVRHWRKIFEILQLPISPGQTFTLLDLMSSNASEKIEEMEEISGRASGEAGIERQVDEIKKKWQELAFIVTPYRDYKDKFILGTVEDIIAALDDHQLKIQTMLGTKYVTEIRPVVEDWEKKLVLISDIIDEWLYCQRQWMYLENIFSAEDIQKQLPQETTKFMQVDKFWKETMIKTNKRPLVQDCCSNEDLLKKFQMYNKMLEDIQKCLENYLETKRAAFPRFYFLSNDELLEILSQTRNPHAVQGHLRKCFDNINRIQFTEEDESKEIVAMQSAEPEIMPEKVPFFASVFAEGAVEHWLFRIQEMMVKTLHDITKKALLDYPENGLERKEWLFKYPAQPILTVDQIKWTEGCTDAIVKMSEGQMTGLSEYNEYMKALIDRMVDIVRGQLNTLERTLMGALIVIDVHARDVTATMTQLNVSQLNDFEWSKQLRYYWEVEEDNCFVKQTNTRFKYRFEYLGNGPRLVITPLTDKCYITLTSAKYLSYGGAPAGPAGTGKTETTKDLAKALAVQCVVFNCSDGLDYKTMGRFFSGLAQSGAWACFDEFNRIDIEVLSVIAQQILTIQVAIRKDVDTFEFEGRTIPLDQNFGVFITMNPGYAGRTELPDNLKALFRPVAMMIPDYRLIAEIILFSEGFSTASVLARKMVNLYKLSSEQLSKQDHYDFGMRAVKSVLVMAGALRRKESQLAEDIVLIRAMRDSNVPKFLEHDLPLFMSIISDLFPGVDIPNIDYGNLQKAIENQLEQQQYQKPAKFITKIIQLMETIMVRHGVMVVGITGTGKTTNIHTLARAMHQLEKEGSTDYYHKQVKLERLNPKSVTMNELFGYTNIMTNEWTDGIAAKIIRDNVTEGTDLKKWIVFDGPVDALWIENMNTVLDDNKMLCLNNGQRIKLPATFTMMFEVQDLAVASPATVSRCGMVYMEPVHLGWEPVLDTWAIRFKEHLHKDKDGKPPQYVNTLVEKIRNFFKDNFKFLRNDCKEVIATVDNNLVQSCLNFVEIVYGEASEVHNFDKLNNNEADHLCSMIFIFSFIWSAGGNLHDSSRQKFSQTIKGKILKILSGFPFDGEVFDYYINFEKKEFKPWTELITEFKFNNEIPYFNILVPTADTVKFKNLLSKLLKNNRNVLLSGETGTGKSVIIQEFLTSLSQDHFVNSVLNFSAQTKSQNLQDLFMDKDKFQRKKKDLLGPPAGKKMIVFIDDVNMPQLESYGAQPPNELFRQIIDQGGFYDLKKLYFMNIKDCNFITACGPPDGGRNPVTPRLFRHFNMLWAPELSQRSMETIFMHILKGFLAESPHKGLDKLAPQIVKTTIDMYLNMKQKFLPTPKKCHYTFNLRDISKVFQGVLQVKYDNCADKEMLLSLWAHECQRVFADRLVDETDKSAFLDYLVTPLTEHFQLEWDKPHLTALLFADYANSQRNYVKIEETFAKLGEKLNRDFLQHYNNTNTQKQMNLVFFQDALMHLTRICRILRQPRGNSLLIGVGGSGRQSLTRMATFICQYNCFSIEIAKNYKEPQWKDDLKKLLKNAGAKNLPQVFLFSDTQIVMESFLEDINNILNTGEVPNLWLAEDLEEIIGDIRPLVKEAKIDETRDKMLKYFVQLVRENLHIVLTFSPVGDKLRNRCRQFPSIINCCGIDWFDKWPEDALLSVADSQYRAQDKLGIQDYVTSLSQISVMIHQSVQDKSVEFYDQLRRHNYVTPTSYLELIKLYIEMMKEQQGILPMKIQKYTVGLQTLEEANREVENLKQKIIAFKPELEKSAKDNAILVKEIEKKKEIAAVEQEKCKTETDAAQIIRDDVNSQRQVCKKELDEALPILEQANNAVKKIDKKMTDEMKSFKQPPAMVGVVMNAVCLLFNEKEDWDAAKKLLGNMKFLDSLVEFKPETVTEKRWQKLRANYLNNPDFTKEKVSNISLAATSLLIWVLAIEKFAKVQKIVAPKEAALKEAEAKLKVVEAELYEKESALREIQEMVQELEKKYEMSMRKSEMLQQQKQTAEIQLNRAEKLVSGLDGESKRWEISKKVLEDDFQNIIGNMILAAASIAYLGPFIYSYRKELLAQWTQECLTMKIPVAKDFSLQRILTEEVQIRDWQENGLPADDLSSENGIFIFNCKRWPLVIDPQGQANRWIKNLGADNNLQTTKLTEPNFLKTLENAIRFGQPVLLENIEEDLDPALEPILLKQTFKKNGQQTLRLGDQDVPYNKDFKFYMTTKLPNPHYIPEICIKTTIINFTVTPQGLEDQLLVEVVRHEQAQLEEKRVNLIVSVSQDKRQLQDLEDKILKLISEAQAQNKILEDEELINTLDQSKTTSQTVNQRIEQSRKTQIEINQTRELYRPIAKRGSVLYFVIAGLSNIDPMYQYSLEFFIKLFKLRLDKAENSADLSVRLAALLEDITRSFFINICRGLFEKDKLLFSFLISTSINIESKSINQRDWSFFIKGPSQEPQINEAAIPTMFNHKQFLYLTALSDLGIAYKPISPSLQDSSDRYLWNQIMESKDPWKCQLPDKLANLDPFQKMLLFKQIREEKLISFVRYYVQESLGELFTKSPLFDLKGSFADSTCTTPIIFVLSPGADPIAYLYQLAKEKDFDQRLKSLSLGQGQGDIAKEMIKTGRRNGDWVCLQNCHLAVSWMTELERIQEMQVEADTHPEYRLWLTSMPSTKFPVPVLQSGIKLTNEPPKGLKANLGRTYNEVDEKEYESCTKRTEYQTLLFSLGFFHAVILERRKFGAIGWNIPYEWMNSDFETCQKQLMIYLNEQPDIPWETLNYLISEINYGGRVTDDKDVRLITALLRKYFNPKIMGEKFDFSQSGIYHTPTDLQLQAVRGYIDNFPTEDDPEVFGLHTNANITFEQKTVKEFFDTLLLGQPRSTGKSATGETPDDIVFKLADKILNEIPENLDLVRVENPNSLDVFRYQEVLQFNRLLSTIKKTLAELKKAIKGLVVMSLTLEKMFESFLLKRVPANWEKVAYPSLKPLGSWVQDLVQRIEFFREWVKSNVMPSYWISAMFFPQGFMTSALQTYARKTHIAIDTLTFKTDVRTIKPEECTEIPDIGVNIHGLYIEGCGWNIPKSSLQESQPKILFVEMPVIWLEPVKTEQYNPKNVYKCPLYKTSTRRGTLSTTGHSTNFVMYMDLKSEDDPDHWIRRGVAMLCLLDD